MTSHLKEHAISAALTFISVFIIEFLTITNGLTYFGEIDWAPAGSAAGLVAVRALLKLVAAASASAVASPKDAPEE